MWKTHTQIVSYYLYIVNNYLIPPANDILTWCHPVHPTPQDRGWWNQEQYIHINLHNRYFKNKITPTPCCVYIQQSSLDSRERGTPCIKRDSYPRGVYKKFNKNKALRKKVHEISIKTKQTKSFPIGAFCKKNIRKKNKPT